MSAESEETSLLVPDSIKDIRSATFQSRKEEYKRRIVAVLVILQWWTLNVLIVLLNKYIFQVYDFKFPLTLTTIHFTISWLGAFLYIQVLRLTPLIEVPNWSDHLARIFPVSALSMANIVLGNIALRYIPVSFMQTVKSFTPAVGVTLEALFFERSYDLRIWASLLPIVAGVALTTATELSFVTTGFVCALSACLANALQMILTEMLLKGKLELDSINTLFYFAPYSVLLLLPPALVVEFSSVAQWTADWRGLDAVVPCMAILVSGFIAFGLNLSVIYAVKATSAVTINVAGNLKVAVSILLSWLLFRNPMTALNVLGCAITVCGCTVYGYVSNLVTVQTKKRAMDESIRIHGIELADSETLADRQEVLGSRRRSDS